MTEQMRAVELEDDVDGYHIDGQPYDFEVGQTVSLPRDVAHRFVRHGWGVYAGDVYEVDDEDYREEIGVDTDEHDVRDPSEMTVAEVEEYVEDLDEDEIEELRRLEQEGDDRTTALDAIDEQL